LFHIDSVESLKYMEELNTELFPFQSSLHCYDKFGFNLEPFTLPKDVNISPSSVKYFEELLPLCLMPSFVLFMFTAEQAKRFFLQSGLNTQKLGQIW